MRPGLGFESAEPRPRKSSAAGSPSLTGERSSAPSTTFFLSRDPDGPRPRSENNTNPLPTPSPVSSLEDTIQEAEASAKYATIRPAEVRSGSRRRSTIRPGNRDRLRRGSSAAHCEASHSQRVRGVTPSPRPSRDVSLASSPKSASSRSLHQSDDELTNDETGSQVIGSSEDDEIEPPAVVQDSQPELIMPSIKMPSRRPFTGRGKRLGRFKVMVAGRKGSAWAQVLM